MFKLNEILEGDTFLVQDLKLCQLRLMNNEFYPWLILVPRRENISEIFELNAADQEQLMVEISQISKLVKEVFIADKINVAALGNMVNQLHIHVIARFKNDRVFPKPVWLDPESKKYDKEKSSKILKLIQENVRGA